MYLIDNTQLDHGRNTWCGSGELHSQAGRSSPLRQRTRRGHYLLLYFVGSALDTKHLADYGTTGDRPTSRNAERVPMTYLFPSPENPIHGRSVKPPGFIVAEGSCTKAQLPVCRVEPFLVNPRILFCDRDGHDGVLFNKDVE